MINAGLGLTGRAGSAAGPSLGAVAADSDVRSVLADPGFRWLLATRLLSQLADGVLQAGLASYVLFSPEKQATGARIAVSFAVLLLPYSLVGPFAGVLIDRWRRRQILVRSNVLRAGLLIPLALLVVAGNDGPLFVALALASLGVNRFFLSALSAGLPHVVQPGRLVTANALATTSGTVAVTAGAGLGLLTRLVLGSGYGAAAATVGAAGACYLVSALAATRLGRDQLGPDAGTDTGTDTGTGTDMDTDTGTDTGADTSTDPADQVRPAQGPSPWARELAALGSGIRYLYHRRAARDALATLGVFRMAFGVMTVVIVLLERETFHRPADANGGLRGVAITFVAVAIGVPVGAVLTPGAVRRWGAGWWIPGLMVTAAVALLVLGLPFRESPLVVAGFVFGLTAQGAKVSVDATVQRTVDDRHRGLVFALYDVLFNVAFVVAAAIAAAALPGSGRSAPVLLGTAAALVAAGTWYWRVTPR
jgi:MFS family permease